jgi:arylsulfatase A
MGYGDVSSLNPNAKVSTPAIDNLAKDGIVFTDAHASGSVCIPSRYGLLTGRYAFRRQEGERSAPWGYLPPYIESGRETLASILKKKGYATACVGKWHLGLNWPTKDGYGNVLFLTRKQGVQISNIINQYWMAPMIMDLIIHLFILLQRICLHMFLLNTQVVDPEIVLTTEIYPSVLEETELDWDSSKVDTDKGDVYWGRGVWWRRGEMSNSFRLEECFPEILNEGLSYIKLKNCLVMLVLVL